LFFLQAKKDKEAADKKKKEDEAKVNPAANCTMPKTVPDAEEHEKRALTVLL
jgi:hypothetical protein